MNGAKGTLGAVQDAERGAFGNIATQGIAVATGLQGHFDWTGAAVGAAVGSIDARNFGGRPASGMAGALAGGATRSVIDGSDFGDNVLAAIPDVIGCTIGTEIAGALEATFSKAPSESIAASAGLRYWVQPQDQYGVPITGPDIIVTVSRIKSFGDWLEGNASDLWSAIGGDTLVQRLTNDIAHSLSDQNFGRTAIDSAAMIVGGPGISAWVDSRLSPRNAAAFGGAIKQDLVGGVHTLAGAVALFRGDIFNPDAQVLVNGGVGAVNYVGSRVTDPMLAASDVAHVYAAAKQGYNQFTQLDTAGKEEMLFRGAGHAATMIAATAATGGLGDAAIIARSGTELIEPLAARGAPSLEALYKAEYSATYERSAATIRGQIADGTIVAPKGIPPQLFEGQQIDALATRDLRLFADAQGHGADMVRINRRLYLAGVGGKYRIPDVYFPQSGTILDGTIGTKTLRTPQIIDFRTATSNAPIGIVRPQSNGGFYWLGN